MERQSARDGAARMSVIRGSRGGANRCGLGTGRRRATRAVATVGACRLATTGWSGRFRRGHRWRFGESAGGRVSVGNRAKAGVRIAGAWCGCGRGGKCGGPISAWPDILGGQLETVRGAGWAAHCLCLVAERARVFAVERLPDPAGESVRAGVAHQHRGPSDFLHQSGRPLDQQQQGGGDALAEPGQAHDRNGLQEGIGPGGGARCRGAI